MTRKVKFGSGGETTDKESDKSKTRKLTTAEKVLSYPARVAILGGAAAGKAADQALYNSGLMDKDNPRFSKETREGRGYEEAKKLGRKAIGLDSLEEPEGKKKGGKVKKLASGGFPDLNDDGKVTRADVLKGRGVPGFKSGKWIQSAIKKPGALRAQLGVKGDKPIPAGKLAKAAKAPGKLGQRARLAQTLKKMK